jgi:enediyne biosynthesis protein E4
MQKKNLLLLALLLLSTMPAALRSQFFVKVTDTNNPIVVEPSGLTYLGTSWVDVDGDERLDLYICGKDIFKNLGNGNFVKLVNSIPLQGSVIGNSWSDYDNDGDTDVFIVAPIQSSSTSHLYRNDGTGMFTKILTGSIADSSANSGWGCSWGDMNNDTYPDLVIAAAFGFNGVNHNNRLYYNNGDGSFTRIDTTNVTDSTDAFTVPMFSDYDQDGDVDLFIGTGPANNIGSLDYLWRNMQKEQSVPYYFSRIDTGVIGTDIVDGQNWNWVDVDNDGDLDGFLTNYSQSIPNRLYRCEGPRYYVRMTAAEVGTIVTDQGLWLTNTWGDFDNDGDQDCYITCDGGNSKYYSNNGSGFFTSIDTLSLVLNGRTFGATAGDYDNDGDLDLYVAGGPVTKSLHRNETNNNNKWVNIRCIGMGPTAGMTNKSALGTIVKVKAMINGMPKWQIREINAQNGFNSMNMLNIHFGLGNAAIIDSVIIKWGGGLTQVFTNVAADKFYKAIEGQGLNEVIIGVSQISTQVPGSYKLHQNYPNPFNPVTKIKFDISKASNVKLMVYDVTGRLVSTPVNGYMQAGEFETDFNSSGLSSGTYFYRLEAEGFTSTKKMVLIK